MIRSGRCSREAQSLLAVVGGEHFVTGARRRLNARICVTYISSSTTRILRLCITSVRKKSRPILRAAGARGATYSSIGLMGGETKAEEWRSGEGMNGECGAFNS